MGNSVTSTSASVMWRKMVLLLFFPRLLFPSIRVYRARLLPTREKMNSPGNIIFILKRRLKM